MELWGGEGVMWDEMDGGEEGALGGCEGWGSWG